MSNLPKQHSTAVVAPNAQVDPTCTIGPYAVIGPDVRLGPGNVVGSHVVIEGRTEIGADNRFLTSCAIGGSPQVAGAADHQGALRIGDRNVFREFVTVHGGLREPTVIGSEGLFMANAHVAHDCWLSDRVVLANGATLGGHVVLEQGAQVSGLSAVHQYVRIGPYAFVAGGAMVVQDVPPFCVVQGDRARLAGLNTVGLRRAGFSEDAIRSLRRAYRTLFYGAGALEERIRDALALADEPHVRTFTAFLRGGQRGVITTPRRREATAGREASC